MINKSLLKRGRKYTNLKKKALQEMNKLKKQIDDLLILYKKNK